MTAIKTYVEPRDLLPNETLMCSQLSRWLESPVDLSGEALA